MTAYNAANEADYLRHARIYQITTAVSILLREDEGHLAEALVARSAEAMSAQAVVAFLVARRPPAPLEWDRLAPRDEALEALIVTAQEDRERANARLTETMQSVEAVADRIIARTPGAAYADLGVA